MSRLIFIHGNLDVPASFTPLLPLLPPVPTLCIDMIDTFQGWPAGLPVDVVEVAKRVARQYSVGPDDVVLGHSMGGWIAAHLKAQTGADTILLNSWTDPRKVNAPIQNLTWLKRLVYSRFYQRRWLIRLAKTFYPIPSSRPRIRAALDRLATIDPDYMFWQYQLIFTPVATPAPQPNLRIHTSTLR